MVWPNQTVQHPLDEALAVHVQAKHSREVLQCLDAKFDAAYKEEYVSPLHKEALEIKEGETVAVVNESKDRKAIEHIMQKDNNKNIRSSICFNCAYIKVDSEGIRSDDAKFPFASIAFHK